MGLRPANPKCRKCWKCRIVEYKSDDRWINPKTEEEEIYLAASSEEPDRAFYVISFLIAQGSFTAADIIGDLIIRLKKVQNVRLQRCLFSDSVKCLDELIKLHKMHMPESDFIKGYILLGIATARPEKIDLINRLLDLGCPINFTDGVRRSILHVLICNFSDDFSSRPYQQVAELLIKRGIDIDLRDNIDQTALEYTITYENLEMLNLLLRNGATEIWDEYESIAEFAYLENSIACLQSIIKFFIVRKIQEKEVDEKIMNSIATYKEINEHYNLCLKDLESLKQNIVNTNVSLYNILFEPLYNVVQYLRNQNVLTEIQRVIMEKSDFTYDFIEIRDKALIRRDLEDSSLVALKKVLKLPESCLKLIIFFLDNDNLKNVATLGNFVQTEKCEQALQSCLLKN